jgi:hypothetical protein
MAQQIERAKVVARQSRVRQHRSRVAPAEAIKRKRS